MVESCGHPEEHRATAQATSAAYVEILDAAAQDSVRQSKTQWVVADVRTDEVPPTLVVGVRDCIQVVVL